MAYNSYALTRIDEIFHRYESWRKYSLPSLMILGSLSYALTRIDELFHRYKSWRGYSLPSLRILGSLSYALTRIDECCPSIRVVAWV